MIVVGITGGIGTGKSTVGAYIQSKGFPFISSDVNAKEIMNTDTELQQAFVEKFGTKVLVDGVINSKFLAKQLFGKENEKNREFVNSLVHPKTIAKMMEQVDQFENEGASIVFVESALLYEVSLDEGFDYVVVVDANDDIRIQRVMERSGETREEVVERIDAQLSQKWKVQQADFVVDNNKSVQDLYKSLDFLLLILPTLPPKSFDTEDSEEVDEEE
jgi:dephospho-CoA kinase